MQAQLYSRELLAPQPRFWKQFLGKMGHKWSHKWQNKRNSGEKKELFGVVFTYEGFGRFGLFVEVELLEGIP